MRAVKKVASRFSSVSRDVHARRWMLVWDVVTALVSGASATVTDIGRHLPGGLSEKHAIKRADRALSNAHLFEERLIWYRQLAHVVLGKAKRPVILVDGTDLGSGLASLRASVSVDGRGVTIFDEVATKQAIDTPRVHHAFLQHLREVLPDGCCPTLVVDGAFRVPFFRRVENLGWDFVGRLGSRVWIHQGDEQGQVRDWFKSLPRKRPIDLGEQQVTLSNSYTARCVFYDGRSSRAKSKARRLGSGQRGQNRERKRRKRACEPWALVTSRTDITASQVVALYTRRMEIEESFRDDKSARFGRGLALSRCHSAERRAVILLLLALAQLTILLAGLSAEAQGLARRFQANSIRVRRVLSLLFLGARALARGTPVDLSQGQTLLQLRAANPLP